MRDEAFGYSLPEALQPEHSPDFEFGVYLNPEEPTFLGFLIMISLYKSLKGRFFRVNLGLAVGEGFPGSGVFVGRCIPRRTRPKLKRQPSRPALRLMDKILHHFKYPKLWELWYIPSNG